MPQAPEEEQVVPKERPRAARIGRHIGVGVYVFVIVVVGIWALVSALAVHVGFGNGVPHFRGKQISATAPSLKELRGCHREVWRLLSNLHRETFRVWADALKIASKGPAFKTAPAVEWRNWTAAWRRRWKSVERRCRLRELGGRGISSEIDQLYDVHQALDGLQLAYSGAVDRFIEQYAKRLRRQRDKLRTIRGLIEQRSKRQTAAAK